MWWCWGKRTSVICWRITRPTTTGCARTLRSTRMLRSIDLRRQSSLSHQSLGSAVSIGTTFGWHNRYTQVFVTPLLPDVAVLHPVRSWFPHRVDEVSVLGRLEPIADPPATRCVDDNSIARG